MFYVYRVAPNLVMFTDVESDTGFHKEFLLKVFERLQFHPVLNLPLDICIKLYWQMCEYRHIYIKEGKLFRKKRDKLIPHTYYKIPTTKFTPEQELERELDGHLKRINEMSSDDEFNKEEIVGIRYDR